jgi:hypothetical protein
MMADCIIDENVFGLTDLDVIEEVINRNSVEIPDTFLPSANRIALVNLNFLWLANPPPPHPFQRAGHWSGRAREGVYRKIGVDYVLSVRRYGKLWSIERKVYKVFGAPVEVLAFASGPTPIFLRSHEEAKMIARPCHPNPREETQSVWIPISA